MDDNQLSMLRYSLKQCEKSFRDACDDPRRWEQALGHSDGLLDQVAQLPADERRTWEGKLNQWLPLMRAGARRAVGDRVLRQIDACLASAEERLAQDSDPSHDFERLERELAHPGTGDCVDAAELARVRARLAELQAELAGRVADRQSEVTADRIAHADARLGELEAAIAHGGAASHAQLARVVGGDLSSARFELDALPHGHADHAALAASLRCLDQRFAGLSSGLAEGIPC